MTTQQHRRLYFSCPFPELKTLLRTKVTFQKGIWPLYKDFYMLYQSVLSYFKFGSNRLLASSLHLEQKQSFAFSRSFSWGPSAEPSALPLTQQGGQAVV